LQKREEDKLVELQLLELDWDTIFTALFRIVMAFLLAMPIAFNRERQTRIMGLRTFPLVSIASCGYIVLSNSFIPPDEYDAQARILQGLLSGIGFIGGGAILKEGGSVTGTATAASVWSTGAIGAAAAYGNYEIGLLISLANLLILRLLTPLKRPIDETAERPE
jgi:putative Mg2+ transporter-C (MgtC) family protein